MTRGAMPVGTFCHRSRRSNGGFMEGVCSWFLFSCLSLACIVSCTLARPADRNASVVPQCSWPKYPIHHHCELEFCLDESRNRTLDTSCAYLYEYSHSVFLQPEDIVGCAGATAPGKPRELNTFKERFNQHTFYIPVQWNDPEDTTNLIGYSVKVRSGKNPHNVPIGNFDIPKRLLLGDVNSLYLGLSNKDCPIETLCVIPEDWTREDLIDERFPTSFTVSVTSLPAVGDGDAQTDSRPFDIPSCKTLLCPPQLIPWAKLETCIEFMGNPEFVERRICHCTDDPEPPTNDTVVASSPNVGSGVQPSSVSPISSGSISSSSSATTTSVLVSSGPTAVSDTATPTSGSSVPVLIASCAGGSVVVLVIIILIVLLLQPDSPKWRVLPKFLWACVGPCVKPAPPKLSRISTSTELSDSSLSSAENGRSTLVSQVGSIKSSSVVYISHSRFSQSIREQASRLCADLRSRGILAILDVFEENAIADNHTAWFENRIGKADYVVVLLDEKHPLHQNKAMIETTLALDYDGSYARSVTEALVLQGTAYASRTNFLIPVFIGSPLAQYRSITPSVLRGKTMIRLPLDFTADSPKFQELLARIKSPDYRPSHRNPDPITDDV